MKIYLCAVSHMCICGNVSARLKTFLFCFGGAMLYLEGHLND